MLNHKTFRLACDCPDCGGSMTESVELNLATGTRGPRIMACDDCGMAIPLTLDDVAGALSLTLIRYGLGAIIPDEGCTRTNVRFNFIRFDEAIPATKGGS